MEAAAIHQVEDANLDRRFRRLRLARSLCWILLAGFLLMLIYLISL